MTCVTACNLWKLKNENRNLFEKLRKSTFTEDLLNTLKNKRRLQILGAISTERQSANGFRQRLKRLGYSHSQRTIVEEYINPLIRVGLLENHQSQYHATVFGVRISKLIGDFLELGDVLPPHSECCEEAVLDILLEKPRTHEEFARLVPKKSLGRVIKRLHVAGLIETAADKDYVFFFRTKRDQDNEQLSPTQKKVYENVPDEGIPARRLANKTGISLRRIYKYIRGLKGRKLIFVRKKPKTYSLTAKGIRTARMLRDIMGLVAEVSEAAKLVVDMENSRLSTSMTPRIDKDEIVHLARARDTDLD